MSARKTVDNDTLTLEKGDSLVLDAMVEAGKQMFRRRLIAFSNGYFLAVLRPEKGGNYLVQVCAKTPEGYVAKVNPAPGEFPEAQYRRTAREVEAIMCGIRSREKHSQAETPRKGTARNAFKAMVRSYINP